MDELKWYNINRDVRWKDVIPSRAKRLIALCWVGLGWGNFLAFMVIALCFGGTAQEGLMGGGGRDEYFVLDRNGEVRTVSYEEYKRLQTQEGKYFVSNHGTPAQVSSGVYHYLRMHGNITYPLFLSTFVVALILAATWHGYAKKNKVGMYSDQAEHVMRRMRLVAWVLVILVIGFLVTFWLLLLLT
jgi:hypothetical protein